MIPTHPKTIRTTSQNHPKNVPTSFGIIMESSWTHHMIIWNITIYFGVISCCFGVISFCFGVMTFCFGIMTFCFAFNCSCICVERFGCGWVVRRRRTPLPSPSPIHAWGDGLHSMPPSTKRWREPRSSGSVMRFWAAWRSPMNPLSGAKLSARSNSISIWGLRGCCISAKNDPKRLPMTPIRKRRMAKVQTLPPSRRKRLESHTTC